MKALVLIDSENKTPVCNSLHGQVAHLLEQKGYEITTKEVDRTLHCCIGCFGCWVKTPGECVIRDDMAEINRLYINSDAVVFLSPVVFGQFGVNMKNVIDRILPRLLPFFINKADGSTAHPFRYTKNPEQFFIGYGSGLSEEDIQLFNAVTAKHHPEANVCVYQGTQDEKEIEALFGQGHGSRALPGTDYQIPEIPRAPEEIPGKDSGRKKVVFVNGSPRAQEQTASASFIARAEKQFDGALFEKEIISVRKTLQSQPENAFEKIRTADAVVFVFPLYVFCLPGMLAQFLRDYAAFLEKNGLKQNRTLAYAVVNCGFPEPYINAEAAGVVRSFCRHVGMEFRSGILIGGGVMITAAEKAPPVRKVLKQIDAAFSAASEDIRNTPVQPPEDVQIKVSFPKKLFFFAGSMNWKVQAKHNGLKVKDMYRRPYI